MELTYAGLVKEISVLEAARTSFDWEDPRVAQLAEREVNLRKLLAKTSEQQWAVAAWRRKVANSRRKKMQKVIPSGGDAA